MHPHKVLSQANSCAAAVAEILWCSLGEMRPADRSLAALLRRERHFGGRDRRLLSEAVFASLRWWGWIHDLAPPAFLAALDAATQGDGAREENYSLGTDEREWSLLLTAAHILEGRTSAPAIRVWAEQAGISLPAGNLYETPPSLAERRKRLARLLARSVPLPFEALLPAWAVAEMACPKPLVEFLEWQQRRPPIWLRAQTEAVEALLGELRDAGLEVEPHEVLPQALRLRRATVNLRTLPAFRRGAFEIQDLASQIIGLVCRPRSGERWWDACAGAGGKTLHLADLMKRKGSIIASDRRVYKLKDLRLRARRAGFPNIRTREWKGKSLPSRKGGFDGVLVDAPCTCSGTWRRNPDARWNTTKARVAEAVALQSRLLQHAGAAVKPGGVLVYATCSIFVRENDDVVSSFLAANERFVLDPFVAPLHGDTTDGTLRIWPWDGDCDAMFVARFRCRE